MNDTNDICSLCKYVIIRSKTTKTICEAEKQVQACHHLKVGTKDRLTWSLLMYHVYIYPVRLIASIWAVIGWWEEVVNRNNVGI